MNAMTRYQQKWNISYKLDLLAIPRNTISERFQSPGHHAIYCTPKVLYRIIRGGPGHRHTCVQSYVYSLQNSQWREAEIHSCMALQRRLVYCSSLFKQCQTCEDAIDALKKWYNNIDKHLRTLFKWQSVDFTEEVRNIPSESEVQLFPKFVGKSVFLQKQLDPSYHSESLLRYRFIFAVDLLAMQIALRSHIPRATQQFTNCIINSPSEKLNTAESAYTSFNQREARSNEEEKMYTIGQHYGKVARRKIRPYGSKGFSSAKFCCQAVYTRDRIERLSLL